MSTTDWQQPGGGFPGPSPARRWPFVRIAIALILLAALAWVLLLTAQYCATKKPISVIPPPVSDVFSKASFQYVDSINGLQNPMGVAVAADGTLYVTETGGERLIHIFDSRWQEIGSFAPPDTVPAGRVPVYVAVSPGGDVYVSDRNSASIFVFTADGTPKGTVDPPVGFEDWHPLGLAFDQEGNLYVSDVTPDKHRVVIMDPAGRLKLTFGSQGEQDGQFWFPNGIAVDSQERIYVADSNNGRMQAFDKDGNFLFKINRGMSRGDLSIPRGIAIDGEGRLLIADTYRGAVQAYAISDSADASDAAPLEFIGGFSGSAGAGVFLLFPNGLALDGHGKIFVADRTNNRIQIWKY